MRRTRDDEAVSAVVSTILMVALTIIISATVFVLVNQIGQSTETSASFQVEKTEATDRLKIIRAPETLSWHELQIQFNDAAATGVNFTLRDAASVEHGPTLAPSASWTPIVNAHLPMRAGDELRFQIGGSGAADVEVWIRDVDANQIVGIWTFFDIA